MSDKQDLRVREARKAARIVAANHSITYQQALDRVAQDAGGAHWTGFMADPSLSVSLSTYKVATLTFEGPPADVDPIIAFTRMARSADGIAHRVRSLLDSAEHLTREGEGLSAAGQSPSNALSHAELLMEQVGHLAQSLDDLAKDVLSLYDGHPRRDDQVINARAPRQHYEDIQERIGSLTRRIQAARMKQPASSSADNAVDYYHRMRFGRTWHGRLGDDDLYAMANEANSPDSLAANYIFYRYTTLLRNMPSRMDREDGKVIADWLRWTGYALHNMPQVASGAYDHYDAEDSQLAVQCRRFMDDAKTGSIPAYWHPDHPEFDRWMNKGELWVEICDFIARRAGCQPVYGVPMETRDVSYEMQPFPEPPPAILGLHKASTMTDYARRVHDWADWLSRGRRIIVQRWKPSEPEPLFAGDEPRGEHG